MRFGIVFEQGDILIVPFPFSDLTSVRQRPVIIVSKTEDNEKTDDVITCGITSNLKDSKYSILIDNEDLESGRIPKKSRIKVNKIFTLEKKIVKKKVGKVKISILDRVKEEFRGLV